MWTRWTAALAQATRALLRAPGFSAVTVLTLGLAIGANAAIFSVVDAVLLSPLPFADADRLVAIKSSTPGNNTPPEFGVSPEFYVQYRDHAPGLADLALYSGFGGTLRVDGEAERVRGAEVSSTFFSTLGVRPLLGRLPTAEEVRSSGTPTVRQESTADVVLISHALWQRSFGAAPDVVGRTLQLNDRTRTIVGVMPAELRLPQAETVVWVPFEVGDIQSLEPGQFRWDVVGRLAPGASVEELAGQLTPLAMRLPELFPDSPRYSSFITDGQYRAVVRPLAAEIVFGLDRPLWILLGTMGFVLLIACANVANLFLVRAEGRQRDIAVRAALGAGRARLVRAFLAEALVLAAAGGVLGAALASLGVPLLVRAAPQGIPRLDLAGLDPGVLGFTAAISLVSSLLFGLGAAMRHSSPGVLASLRSAGRGSVGGRDRQVGRNALVVAQSGLGLVLLVGSALLFRSFLALTRTDAGFETEGILSFQTALPFGSYGSPGEMASFHTRLVQRLEGLPGVESAGTVQELPLDEGAAGSGMVFEQTVPEEGLPPITYYTFAGPGYFETMGIELEAGRTFVEADHETDLGHVIVSRQVAERYWPGEDPLGKRLHFAGDATGWETVVGVVADVRDRDLREESRGLVYFPLVSRNGANGWFVPSPAYVLRADDPARLIAAAREELRALDASLPMYAVKTMEQVVAENVERLSFTMLAVGVAALLALVLGAVGLYGVLSYVVSQRTREIGLRLALGAHPGAVRRMVVGQGARLAVLGMFGGLVAASALTRVLQELLYGTEALDPLTFSSMSAVMLAVGLLASYLPARRASAVDPMDSMRAD